MAVMQLNEVRDCFLGNGVFCSDPVPVARTNSVARNGSSGVGVEEVADLAEWILIIVTPSVSFFGIFGNILSLVILLRHGLQKSSNILLFCLAVSDILFVIAKVISPKGRHELVPLGFPYPELTSHVVYYLYQLADCLNWVMGPTSLCIPALIMVERLIAVFLPLRFSSLVTARRTVLAVSIPLVFFILLQVYIRTWARSDQVVVPSRNTTLRISDSARMYWNRHKVRTLIEVCMPLFFLLIFLVGCSCVAIGIKMKLLSRKRLTPATSVTKTDVGCSRTTRMLLCLCTFHTCACMSAILPAIIPDFITDPMIMNMPNHRSVSILMHHVDNLVFCVNASCNFYIYMATNKKFRQTFVEILCRQQRYSFRRLLSVE